MHSSFLTHCSSYLWLCLVPSSAVLLHPSHDGSVVCRQWSGYVALLGSSWCGGENLLSGRLAVSAHAVTLVGAQWEARGDELVWRTLGIKSIVCANSVSGV